MAIPVLKLNLAPEPSLWRQNHEAFGWGAVGLGVLLLLGTSAFTGWKYVKATREASRNVRITAEAGKVASEQSQLASSLRTVDVSTELPRWKLAERILSERSLPWSRLTAELERSLVQDVRVKSIQRTRGTDQTVQLALKGEARSRDAEVKFIEKLQGNGVFTQVLMEREAERQGGGLDFELKLPATTTPAAYEPLPEPEYGHSPAPVAAPRVPATPATPANRGAAPAPVSVKPGLPSPLGIPGAGATRPDADMLRSRRMQQMEALRQRSLEANPGRPRGGLGARLPATEDRKEQP
jgi:hypothetical protein